MRLVVAAAAKDGGAGVLVSKFLGPLPDVADQVLHAERACSERVSVNVVGSAQGPAFLGDGYSRIIPRLTPGIDALVGPLCGILPFPFVRQTFSGPCSVGAGVFERDPGDGFVTPSFPISAVLPVAQEVQIIFRTIVGRIQKLFELRVGDGILVDPEGIHVQRVQVVTARRVFPGILDVDSNVVKAFGLDAANLESKIGCRNFDHAGGRAGCGRARGDWDDLLREELPLARIFG